MRLAPLFATAIVLGAGSLAAIGARAAAPIEPTTAQSTADPFIWLEDIHGARALAWVKQQNARTAKVLEADPRYEPYREQALAIFTARDRIPFPNFLGDGVSNLWQDKAHPHGLWRRTSLTSYASADPQWETLLDLDGLSKAEDKSWFFKGATCLRPAERYCLVRLSNGGGDAVRMREFDTKTNGFVPSDSRGGGFDFPIGKQSADWVDHDTLILERDFGPGTMTKSGYAFTARLVKRGSSLEQAPVVFKGEPTDGGGVRARVLRDPDGAMQAVIFERQISDYDVEDYLYRGEHAAPVRLAFPRKSRMGPYVQGQLAFTIQQDWKGFKAGDLLTYDLAALKKSPEGATPHLVLHPNAHQTIDEVRATKDRLLVALLDDVKGKVLDFAYADGRWTPTTLKLPGFSAVSIRAASEESDRAFVTSESFLEPTSLWAVDAAAATATMVKQLPAKFDASNDTVEQLWATSNDGTRVPYFLVRPKGMKYDGSTPTQMFGYGGFLISEVPIYRPEMGKLWLEKGGAYVLADIRGGGEFGPKWHDAALREHRQRAFDDFASIARDLFKRKITSPRRLGIYGRSNGGVLMSVSMTQHPDYWNAVVIESPLIDMLRYNHLSAGASWMGEYGDPDIPADRAFIAKYSAYQNLKRGVKYPEPYITTNTEDDRVHPGHARKFAAKLESFGDPYLFYENTFGGHANDADPELNARRWARHYVYLTQKLID